MPTIAENLRMLRDVDGIHGSFVVAATGTLVGSDLPSVFDEELLGQIGPRIARLYETFFSGGADLATLETCVLRYADHKLYVRRMTWGIIAILSSVTVNLPALRMVANLVIRRIDPEIALISTSGVSPSSGGSSTVTKTLPSPAPRQALDLVVEPDPKTSPLMPAIAAHDPLPVIPEDGRDPEPASNERHARMYRGRPVSE